MFFLFESFYHYWDFSENLLLPPQIIIAIFTCIDIAKYKNIFSWFKKKEPKNKYNYVENNFVIAYTVEVFACFLFSYRLWKKPYCGSLMKGLPDSWKKMLK